MGEKEGKGDRKGGREGENMPRLVSFLLWDPTTHIKAGLPSTCYPLEMTSYRHPELCFRNVHAFSDSTPHRSTLMWSSSNTNKTERSKDQQKPISNVLLLGQIKGVMKDKRSHVLKYSMLCPKEKTWVTKWNIWS